MNADQLLLKNGFDIQGNRIKSHNKKKKKSKVKSVPVFNPKAKEVVARMKQSNGLIQLRRWSEVSEGELAIITFLVQNDIEFKREHFGPKLFNPKTNALLFLDFYLPQYNLAIEFDGCHHYKVLNGDKKRLEDVRHRDRIKNEFCQKNKVHLLRIRSIKNIEKSICDKIDSIAGI